MNAFDCGVQLGLISHEQLNTFSVFVQHDLIISTGPGNNGPMRGSLGHFDRFEEDRHRGSANPNRGSANPNRGSPNRPNSFHRGRSSTHLR